MSDYHTSQSKQHIQTLDHFVNGLSDRKMTEGKATYLGDVTLRDALSFVQQTEFYQEGEYKNINPMDFIPIFESAGLDLDKSVIQNALLLHQKFIGQTEPVATKFLPSYLKFVFKEPSEPIDVNVFSDAASLCKHVVGVVASSPFCHQDFDDTRISLDNSEHIRFLTLG